MRDYDDDDMPADKPKKFDEFDCPECDGLNPQSENLNHGDQVYCNYCGMGFQIFIRDGKMKLKET